MHKEDEILQETDITPDATRPFRVGLVPLPGFAMMSYACTVEPLRAANLLSRKPLYEISHICADQQSQSSGAACIESTHKIGDMPDLDLLLVAAGGDPFAYNNRDCFDWLRRMATRVPQIGGVSGGSVVLANAGLLNGRRMTVHWEHAAEMARKFPQIIIERRLYVIDRDRVTCGGGTAPIDLMHALISDHHGSSFARLVSDWFLHTEIRASAAPQRALTTDQFGPVPVSVSETVAAMENHVADPLTLPQLAMMAGVSTRHLNRLFMDAFDTSTMAFYRALRLKVGRRLVTGSSMQISDIAEATGFATPSHFSNQYAELFQIRPLAERQSVLAETG